jgi:hypothetical protein
MLHPLEGRNTIPYTGEEQKKKTDNPLLKALNPPRNVELS